MIDYSLEEETKYLEQVNQKIKDINNKRMKNILSAMMVIIIIMIGFFYIPRIRNNINPQMNKNYLMISSLMLLVSFAFRHVAKQYGKNPQSKIYDYLYAISNFVYLVEMSVYTLLDFIYMGDGTLYIAALMSTAAVLLIKDKFSYVVFGLAHGFYLFLLWKYAERTLLLEHTVITSTIFVIISMILSKFLYKNQFENIMKNIILEDANRKIKRLSNYDKLTDIPNRRYFEEYIKKEYMSVTEAEDKGIVALADIDFFKKINDTYGHHLGDKVLEKVANIFQNELKEPNLAARWGGEEFAFFVYGYSENEAYLKFDEIRKKVEETSLSDNGAINITVSIGFSELIGFEDKDFEEAFKRADKALYNAKQTGRNKVIYYKK